MSMSMDGDERVDEPFRAFQRSVPGVVCSVRVLCVVLCVVLAVLLGSKSGGHTFGSVQASAVTAPHSLCCVRVVCVVVCCVVLCCVVLY